MNAKISNWLAAAALACSVTAAFAADESSPASGPWWSVFPDATLDRLERRALAANRDLRQAVARVMEARAEASAAAAGFYPNLSAPLLASRERTTNTGPVTTSRLIGGNFFAGTSGSTTLTTTSSCRCPSATRSMSLAGSGAPMTRPTRTPRRPRRTARPSG